MAKIFQPTLVIGLGGTGKGIILALKKMIAENSPKGMGDYPLLKFLSVDTDTAVDTQTTSIRTVKPSELTINKAKETVGLHADFNIVPDLDKDFPEIGEWFPKTLYGSLVPAELQKGAGQRKPIGRFSFAWNASALKTKLANLLSNPVDTDTARQNGIGASNLSDSTNVFICGSICGGTGSGTFLDMAYLVRYVASQITTRQVYIYGMLATSSIFQKIQGDANIKPNCYASLLELDHFTNEINYSNPNRRFYPAYKNIGSNFWDYSKSANTWPIDFPFIFDNTNSEGFSLGSQKAFSEMVARFIYLLTGHEVAAQWQSMDNNVRANLVYNAKILQKPNRYRSMGTYSIMFPRRMAVQMCGYKLAKVYFDTILDDSYNPQEISNLVTRFMNDIKFNPETGLIETLFDNYTTSDGLSDSFASYLENRKSEFLSECEDSDKKEIVQKVREWKESMDKIVNDFKAQNSVTARNLRELFLDKFNKRIAAFVDLKVTQDEDNKSNNEARYDRGSIIRANEFVKALLTIYKDAAIKYHKQADMYSSSIKQYENEFKDKLADLESTVDGFLSTKKKIAESLEDTLGSCVTYLNSKRQSIIIEEIEQLFNGIVELRSEKYPGLIKELENENLLLENGINNFNSVKQDVETYISENRNYNANFLCDTIFDYADDVEGTYKQLLEEKGEDFIFNDLSKKLKDKENNFGEAYENLATLTQSQILISLLRCTEEYFKEPISRIDITDKLLKDEKRLNLLLNGHYYDCADVYIGLDGGELGRVGSNLESSKFFAITIPNIYDTCPCKNIQGTNCNGKICPVDEDEEKYKGDKACPHYPRCLKRMILQNAPTNLAIVPTSETAEINIMTTIAGFPLHAVPSVMECKTMYLQQKQRLEDNQTQGEKEEVLHMFGSVEFTDLAEKSINPLDLLPDFKKLVIFGIALRRIIVQPLLVQFVTLSDIQAGRRDRPSVDLGTSMDDLYNMFQSTRKADMTKIKQVTEELNAIKNMVLQDPEQNKRLAETLKESYEELNKNPPKGITGPDLDLLNDIAKELCGIELIHKSTTTNMW